MVDVRQVDQVLMHGVADGRAPGVVALAADDLDILYSGAFGSRAAGNSHRMTLDTVVWIASMTKAVTSVAAMQLVEQGRVELDEPLGQRVPELTTIQVLDGFEADGTPRLRPPRRPLTLRHLLTHTSGFAYETWNADILRYKAFVGNGNPTPGDEKSGLLMRPLVCDPGDRWVYGTSTDWVGEVVERFSGLSLDEYFRQHIFDPLGMSDTGFLLRPDQQSRLAGMHARQLDGSLEVIEFGPSQPPAYFEGGSGLFSTGPDYLRFLRMLLGGGELVGVRVLRTQTVTEMSQNQIGDLTAGVLKSSIPYNSNDVELFPGMVMKWGLGGLLTTEDAPTGRAAGSTAWAGLANTYYWIDPTRRLTGLILTQIIPFGDAGVLDLFTEFERAIYADHA